MRIARICADQNHDVGVFDRVEILRTGGSTEGLAEAVTRRRMTDARAGIDVVVAEGRADQFLNEISLFIRAARGCHTADRTLAVLFLNAFELGSDAADRLVPRHFAPRLGDLLADHRLQDAFLVVRITPGEAALHAGMAVIGLAVLERHHADDLIALHFRLERTANAAIGAGRDLRPFRLAHRVDVLFAERTRRAGLHAGAAGNA